MNLSQKIDLIRQEPEHIRLRYVWGCVGIVMFGIMILWLFSLQTAFQQDNEVIPFTLNESPAGPTDTTVPTNTPSLESWLKTADSVPEPPTK